MKKAGINMSHVKGSNRSLILNQLKLKPKSRKDIAENSGLTPAAVTILVNELIEQGCVQETGHVAGPAKVGRKKVVLELKKNYKYAIGVNIEGHHLAMGIGNLVGEMLTSKVVKINTFQPSQVLELIVNQAKEMIASLSIDQKDLLGVGVGIVGIVDKSHSKSLHAYGMWNEEVAIGPILTEKLKLPVIVENNVRSLALAEMELTHHRKISDLVFIKIGPGIGSAVILDKEVYPGSYNNSGELGHMIVDIEGKPCRCGQKGCLETLASIAAVIETIEKSYSVTRYPVLDQIIGGQRENITEKILLEAYFKEDPGVVPLMDKMIYYLSIGMVNVLKFYDPHKLILYGDTFRHQFFLDKLAQGIQSVGQIERVEERIESSSLGECRSIGGVVLVTKAMFFNTGAVFEK